MRNDATTSVTDRIDALCEQFEAAWQRCHYPRIDELLDSVNDWGGESFRELLSALVKIDLYHRWRLVAEEKSQESAGPIPVLETKTGSGWPSLFPKKPRLEDYLSAFPELGRALDLPIDLIAEEYRARYRFGDVISQTEFEKRFGARGGRLAGALRAVDRELGKRDLETDRSSDKDEGRKAGVFKICCPHCRNRIEVVENLLADVECPSCGSHFNLIASQSTIAHRGKTKTIGQFELLAQVGAGAFGSVWKAKDNSLDRIVAVKIPRIGQLEADDIEQFLREARAAAQVSHPNIVSVHEVGREGNSVYIVSEFVEGATLGEWLTGQVFTPQEAAELCATIADALHKAHEAGVIHRDLKPGNIMLGLDGQPYLTDFGLAKRETGEITMTVDGRILGTPAYMPPEQARGEGHQADRRSDVYSLGVVLFELLTGELPFRGDSRVLIVQILRNEPPRPRTLKSHIPRDLETICLKCLEKDPARRYSTAQAAADDLRRFIKGQSILARPVGPLGRGWRWCKRNPLVASLIAGLAMAISAGFGGITWQWQRAEDVADTNRQVANRYMWLAKRQRTRSEHAEANYRRVREHLVRAVRAADEAQRQRALLAALRIADETYETVDKLQPDDLDWQVAQGYLSLRFGELTEDLVEPSEVESALQYSRKIFQRLVDDHPGSREYQEYLSESYVRLGMLYRTAGRVERATKSFQAACLLVERLIDEHPNAVEAYHDLAILQLLLGETGGYRQTCQDMLNQFTKPKDVYTGNMLVRTCVLGPDAVEDLEQVVEFAEAILPVDSAAYRRSQTMRGAALYRAGHFAQAAEWLSQLETSDPTAWDWLFLAMAQNQLGGTKVAHTCLGRAAQYIDRPLPGSFSDSAARPWRTITNNPHKTFASWKEKLELELLFVEASGGLQHIQKASH